MDGAAAGSMSLGVQQRHVLPLVHLHHVLPLVGGWRQGQQIQAPLRRRPGGAVNAEHANGAVTLCLRRECGQARDDREDRRGIYEILHRAPILIH